MVDTDRRNRIAAWLLFATVAAAPLPFGSIDRVTISFWCVLLAIAVLASTPPAVRLGHLPIYAWIAMVSAAYAVVLHEQLASDPWFAEPHPIWGQASAVLGTTLPPSASIARNEPYYALGIPLVCMLSLISSFVVCGSRERAYQLLKIIAWSGVAYAAFGIISFIIDPAKVFWREKQVYANVLTSTFLNRNTAALYFGMVAILWELFICDRIRRHFPSGEVQWNLVPQVILSRNSSRLAIEFAMMLVCLIAMAMTGSRAGSIISLGMMVVVFAIFFRRDLSRRYAMIVVALAGIGAGLLLLQFTGGSVSERIEEHGLTDQSRLMTYRATLRIIADHPWFGTGLGTFALSFPQYRPEALTLWGVWNRAHSTVLEIAAEVGIPVAVLVVLGWIVILAVLVHGLRVRRRDLTLPIAGFAAAVVANLHSLIDFSLQIPGFAIPACALVGAGLAQSFATLPMRGTRAAAEAHPAEASR
jgi:O-antigen ligase